MTIITSILTAGTNNHETTAEEANRFTTNFVTPGIVGSLGNTSGVAPMTGGFALSATGTNKIVSIATGDAVITATPSGQASQNLNIRSNAVETKTIADNTSGGTRYDWIYLAVDATKANNPAVNADDVTTVVVNRSTSSVTDTSGAIPAYKQLLGIVTVSNGFTTISNANIADSRTAAGAAVPDGSITTVKLADGAVTNAKVAAGMVVQVARSETSAVSSLTAAIPYDDTIPQITEGTEVITCSITPKSATNVLKVEAEIWTNSSANANVVGALFQDSTANAFAARVRFHSTTQSNSFKLTGFVTAGTTSSTTLRCRLGTSSGTLTINGESTARFLGTVTKSTLTVTEHKA